MAQSEPSPAPLRDCCPSPKTLRREISAMLGLYGARLAVTPTGGVMVLLPGPAEDPEAETYVHLTTTGSETFPSEDPVNAE